MSKIKISKDPNKNWENKNIQFARFIAEAEAAGAFGHNVVKDMATSMDLDFNDVCEIIDLAQKTWDEIKSKM